jgi:lysophospholipase L1-like esterase
MQRGAWARLLPLVLLSACAAAGPDASEPIAGFGYTPVRLDLADLGVPGEDVDAVTVGGVAAYDLVPDGDTLTVTVQGGPPGPAAVRLRVGDAELDAGTVTYAPPVDPLFDRVVAFGASLTQGTWNGTPSLESQLAGPAAVIARQAGAHLPLPLLAHDLFPPIAPSDIGPPPGCAVPDIEGHVATSAAGLLGKLVDDAGSFSWAGGRVDPTLVPANVAVGGWRLAHMLRGVPDDVHYTFMGHLTLDPSGGMLDPLEGGTQIERVEALEPTLIVSTDLFGNDVITAITSGEVDLSQITPEAALAPDLEEVVARLAGTGAEVFLATLPRVDFLLAAQHLRGPELDEVVAAGARYNELLVAEADRYDNVHVVDTASWVDALGSTPLQVGDRQVSTRPFDGLLSLDGVHFTAVGYALFAQRFLDAVEEATGVHVPPPDLAAIAETDPNAPWNLRAQGFDPALCGAAGP